MNRYILVLCTALVSMFAIVGTYYMVSKDEDDHTVQGQRPVTIADPFALPDSNGNEVSLDAVQAEVKVINMWASWSPYSADELHALNKLQDDYKGEVAVVALCRDTNPAEGKEYLSAQSFEHVITYVFDSADEYYQKMDGYAVPETLFLNKDDEVIFHQHGPMSYGEMKSKIDTILTQTW